MESNQQDRTPLSSIMNLFRPFGGAAVRPTKAMIMSTYKLSLCAFGEAIGKHPPSSQIPIACAGHIAGSDDDVVPGEVRALTIQ